MRNDLTAPVWRDLEHFCVVSVVGNRQKGAMRKASMKRGRECSKMFFFVPHWCTMVRNGVIIFAICVHFSVRMFRRLKGCLPGGRGSFRHDWSNSNPAGALLMCFVSLQPKISGIPIWGDVLSYQLSKLKIHCARFPRKMCNVFNDVIVPVNMFWGKLTYRERYTYALYDILWSRRSNQFKT